MLRMAGAASLPASTWTAAEGTDALSIGDSTGGEGTRSTRSRSIGVLVCADAAADRPVSARKHRDLPSIDHPPKKAGGEPDDGSPIRLAARAAEQAGNALHDPLDRAG